MKKKPHKKRQSYKLMSLIKYTFFFNQQLVIETSELNKLYRIHDKRKIESGNSIEIHKICNNMNITGYNLIHLLSTSVDALGFGSKFKYDG